MNIGVIGTGSYLPESIRTNDDLEARLPVDDGWVLARTGIKERRIAAPHQATSDLAAEAARRALQNAGLQAADVDVLILASGTVDQPSPATACFVQAHLGAANAVAFDVAAVCSGFLYGVSIAQDMLTADPKRRYAIVVGAEVYSRFLNFDDKSTCVLLGDGAGAVVLGKTEHGGILARHIGTDGTLADLGFVAGGGSRHPASADTVATGMHFVAMDGRAIRKMIAGKLPELVADVLDSAGMSTSDVSLVVPHQANGMMLREWADLLGINPDLMHQTVMKYGNTGAASVPVTLDDAVRSGCISRGDRVLFASFGAGVAWAAMIIEWV